MTRLTNVPIETYMLAGQAAGLECVVCRFENRVSAQRCHRCAAPLDLTRLGAESRLPLKRLAVLGAAGIGKTTYLGMLMDMLVRRSCSLATTLLGPQSISLQQGVTTALASGWFPNKTGTDPEQWDWVHCRVECQRQRKQFVCLVADFAGEALQMEVEQPGDFPAVRGMLGACDGLLVLADARRLAAGEHNDDYLMLKLLAGVSGAKSKKSRSWCKPNLPPLALVFTKADAVPACLDDPVSFARNHAGTLWGDIERRFPCRHVFAASVTGASGYREAGGRRTMVPLRIEPQGVVEPFGWLVSQLK